MPGGERHEQSRTLGGKQLLTDALNRIYAHLDRERMLLREVNDQVRAVLSARFRCMDSAPSIDAFVGACGERGAVPVESHASNTRWALKVLLPHKNATKLTTPTLSQKIKYFS